MRIHPWSQAPTSPAPPRVVQDGPTFNPKLITGVVLVAFGLTWMMAIICAPKHPPTPAPVPVVQPVGLDWSNFETKVLGMSYAEIEKTYGATHGSNLAADGAAFWVHRRMTSSGKVYDHYTVEWRGATSTQDFNKEGQIIHTWFDFKGAVAVNVIKETRDGDPR